MPSTNVVVRNNGRRGPQGDRGTDGYSPHVLGTKANVGSLPGSGNNLNDAWIVSGSMYIWTGTTWAGPFGGGGSLPTPPSSGKVLTSTGSASGDYDWETPSGVGGGAGSWADVEAFDDFPGAIAAGANPAAALAAIGAQPAATAVTDSDTATTTVAGIVELATNAETTTGTDTVRAVTPAGVKAVVTALRADDTLIQADPTQDTGLARNKGTSGPFVSLLDSGGAIALGIDRLGNLVINGTQLRLMFGWSPGDPDPTVGGTKALPPGVEPCLQLTDIADLPAWVAGTEAVVLVANGGGGGGGGEVVTGQFYGNGLANNHSLAVSDAGTGDTAIAIIAGAGAATLQTDEGTVNPAIKFVNAANTRGLEFNDGTKVGSATERTISVLLKTPSSFSTAFAFLQLQLGSTLCTRISLSASGALRIADGTGAAQWTNSTPLTPSTWYHVLVQVTQATGPSGQVRVRAWARNNASTDTPLVDSGNITGLTIGDHHDTLYFGTAGAVTTTFYLANLRWNEDATAYLGSG